MLGGSVPYSSSRSRNSTCPADNCNDHTSAPPGIHVNRRADVDSRKAGLGFDAGGVDVAVGGGAAVELASAGTGCSVPHPAGLRQGMPPVLERRFAPQTFSRPGAWNVKDPTVPACDTVIGSLAAGANATVTCTATITVDTTNVAAATGTDPLGNPVSKNATANVTVTPITIAGVAVTTLRIDKRGPTNAKAGQVITYRIKITNAGTVTATNVAMRDLLPGGMALAAKPAGVRLVKGVVTFTVGDLAPGASRTILLKVRIDRTASGLRNNVAIASATNAPPVRDNARTRIARAVGRVRVPVVTG